MGDELRDERHHLVGAAFGEELAGKSHAKGVRVGGEDVSKMRNIVAATFFRIMQIVLLPIGAVAYVLFVVKLIAYSRRSGASATVLASFYTRWMQHKLGTRRDEPCQRLMTVPGIGPVTAIRFVARTYS